MLKYVSTKQARYIFALDHQRCHFCGFSNLCDDHWPDLFSFFRFQTEERFSSRMGIVSLFFIGTINVYIVGNSWLIQYFSFCMSLFFVAAAGISLLIGRPFTLQYAKLEMDSKVWDHPLFLRINQIMTGGLGIIFLGVFLVNLYRYFHPGILNGGLVWIIAILLKIVFVNRFPNWYKTRYLLKESDENHSN